MSRRVPDLYVYVGGSHVHHLNYGIFLLSGVGAYLLLWSPQTHGIRLMAALYGIGMALTFDEFGMWLHLGGAYWQRSSLDAIVVLAGIFGLLAFAPSIKRFRPRHWTYAAVLAVALLVFSFLLVESFRYADRILAPKVQRIESQAPK